MINACAKAGDWALTLWLLSEIKTAGLKADIQSFNAALDACTKGSNPEAAVRYYLIIIYCSRRGTTSSC